jgi:uncharacterized membrane protein
VNDEEKQKDSIGSKLKQAGKEEAKNKVKSVAKKLFIKAIPFIAIILVAMILVSCLMAVVTIVFETLQNIWSGIVNFFTGSQTYFELNDEQIDALIQQIEATGIDLEDLELLR